MFLSLLVLALAAGAQAQLCCPAEMVRINNYCVDKWEAAVQNHSPYEPLDGQTIGPAVSAPNQVPQGYISANQAQQSCAAAGKRLCTSDEWLRACRGAASNVYPYGNSYDSSRCNVGRPHPIVRVFGSNARYDNAQMNDPRLNQLDNGLARTGQYSGCVSADGLFDMHGNLHEHVADASGVFRGGFYVDGSINGNGCLYRTTAHDRQHHDYSTGFRCCKNAATSCDGGSAAQPEQPVTQNYGECTGVAGTCLDSTQTTCSTAGGFVSSKCPGLPWNILCCPTAASDNGGNNNNNDDGGNTDDKGSGQSTSYPRCTGVEGQCADIRQQACGNGYVSGKCPGLADEIRCCPDTASKVGVGSSCRDGSGTCLDETRSSCGVSFVSGLCDGPSEVRCCRQTESGDSGDVSAGAGSTPSLPTGQRACSVGGNPGTCIDTSQCPAPFQSFASSTGLTDGGCSSIPSRSVQCCSTPPAGGGAVTDSGAVTGSGSCAGLFFPLASGSLAEISVNWGFARSSGRRCHAGLDIYTGGARTVVAVGSGVVTAILRGWYSCSRGSIDAILVYHESGPLAGKTINYGEVNPGTYSVRVGSRVTAGQTLAVARNCGMLHFELYSGRQTANFRWYPRSSVGSGCASTSMSTKPSQLDDPRPLLNCLKPASARFRHGISFLQEASEADAELFATDLDSEIDDEGLSAGAIVGIVLVLLVLIAAIAVAVFYFVVVRKRDNGSAASDNTIGVENDLYSSSPENGRKDSNAWGDSGSLRPAYAESSPTGAYVCDQCGKKYDFPEDLSQHVELRH